MIVHAAGLFRQNNKLQETIKCRYDTDYSKKRFNTRAVKSGE